MPYNNLYLLCDQSPSGWFEAAVSNLGLNLSAVYTGYSGQLELVERFYREQKGFVFYW